MKSKDNMELSNLTVTSEGVVATQEVATGDGASQELAEGVMASEALPETPIKTKKVSTKKETKEVESLSTQIKTELGQTENEDQKFEREQKALREKAKEEVSAMLAKSKENPSIIRGLKSFGLSILGGASRTKALETIMNSERWLDIWANELTTPELKEGFIQSFEKDITTKYPLVNKDTGKPIQAEHGRPTVDAN